MRTLGTRIFLVVLAAGLIGTTPAWAVNREIVELQTQVQQLQTQLTQMQQSLDERMGVLKHLMDQNTVTPEITTSPAAVASTSTVLPFIPNSASTPTMGSTTIRTQCSHTGNGLRNVLRAFG